jgi:hypothetical protein
MTVCMQSATGVLAIGSIIPNELLWPHLSVARELPAKVPVLRGTLEKRFFNDMDRRDGRANIGFGSIPFKTGNGATCHILTIRYQIEEAQCYWLADMSDIEVWNAIDTWREYRVIPVLFRGGDEVLYSTISYPPAVAELERYRGEVSSEVSREFWDFAVGLASSGFIRSFATTDIEGAALKKLAANVLVTERLKPFADEEIADADRLL